MEDKEKQNEDLASIGLTIIAIAYVVFACVVFLAFIGTRPEYTHLSDWLLHFVDKYGAFLSCIPVIIGVLVAKQQLDAHRRQHVATIKLAFRQELDALQAVKAFALEYTPDHKRLAARYYGPPHPDYMYAAAGFTKPDQKLWLNVTKCDSSKIGQAAFDLLSVLNGGNPYDFIQAETYIISEHLDQVPADKRLVYCANTLIGEITDRHKHLSQYWS